jgi:hypothetical protein
MKSRGDLHDRLQQLKVDPSEGGFEASLRRKLLAAGPPSPPPFWRRIGPQISQPWLLWPAFGAAMGVAVFLILGHAGRAPVAAEFPATKVAVVRVNLSSNVAVQSAQIRVSLPDGLVFWADGQALPQRTFEWTQPLAAGDNAIPIAVRGQRPGQYKMTVSARMGDEQVEHEVLLEVVDG